MTMRIGQALNLSDDIQRIEPRRFEGRVRAVKGLMLEAVGPPQALALGARATVLDLDRPLRCEIVGFSGDRAVLMPFDSAEGVRPGARLLLDPDPISVRPSKAWLGRVFDAFGEPVDGLPPPTRGPHRRPVRANPPSAHARARVGERLETGVRALDIFAACCEGQRLGLFAGSGVGKSSLMAMLARGAAADVVVIGLIGERGREVREFIEDTLGEGLARSVVVAATSDEPPLRRRLAAWTTLAIAESFRDEGLQVLCLLDSVTRFAMAQREIGLAVGEPPTTKGYTPTVFAELPRLLERAGPGNVHGHHGHKVGAITGLFTVLVDGDDHNEPIADAARGILDGHIVMSRNIAERGRYPAIDILKSLSRLMPGCHTPNERRLVARARALLAAYADLEELIRIGAYQSGADPKVDEAIRLRPALEAFLTQRMDEKEPRDAAFARLAAILGPEA